MNKIKVKRKTMVKWNHVKSMDTFCYQFIYSHIYNFIIIIFILEIIKSMINHMIERFDILADLHLEWLYYHFLPVHEDLQCCFKSNDFSTPSICLHNYIKFFMLSKSQINPKITNGCKFMGVVLDGLQPSLCCQSLFQM